MLVDLSDMIEKDVEYQVNLHRTVGNPALPKLQTDILGVINFTKLCSIVQGSSSGV